MERYLPSHEAKNDTYWSLRRFRLPERPSHQHEEILEESTDVPLLTSEGDSPESDPAEANSV